MEALRIVERLRITEPLSETEEGDIAWLLLLLLPVAPLFIAPNSAMIVDSSRSPTNRQARRSFVPRQHRSKALMTDPGSRKNRRAFSVELETSTVKDCCCVKRRETTLRRVMESIEGDDDETPPSAA
jgi:hypothetical protein